MFKWLKSKLAGESGAEANTAAADRQTLVDIDDEDPALLGTIKLVSVWDVVDKYLVQNPQPTPYTVHALIKAGAAELLDPAELSQVCEKIQEHGYQYPINGVLLTHLAESELLSFLRWQSKSAIPQDAYDNELRIVELVERFRAS